MAESLVEKSCVPCQGGIPPLDPAEAERLAAQIPGWSLLDGGRRLERSYRFGDFAETLAFVNALGALAESEFHHPDICFGWGSCTVNWQTKKISGLHENDFIMAAKTDALIG